ncbi:MAG: hypothetical protein ACM3JD_15460 [Rudaea sp.]
MPRLDIHTKFHIDLDYWKSQGRDLREQLWDELCGECRQLYTLEDVRDVDRVDPQTGEVSRWDALWECIMDQCGRQPEYISPKMPLTRSILRVLLAGGNAPMSAAELHKRIGKATPQVVLKELLGPEMEDDGIMPVQ